MSAPAAPTPTKATPRPGEVTKSWMGSLGEVSLPDDPKKSAGPPADPPPVKEPAPPPTEPAAKVPVDEKPLGDDPSRWPRSAQEWKKFREEREREKAERDSRIKTLEEELTGLKGKTSSLIDPKEVESIKQERDALSDRLRVVSVQQHPKFQAYFNNKTQAQMDMAKRIVGEEQAGEIEKVLKLPDSDYRTAKLEEILGGLSQLKATQFGVVLNNLEEIEMERQNEIARADKTYQEMIESEKRNGSERRQTLEKVFNSAVERLSGKDGLPVFQTKEGDDAWNAGVKKRIETAKSILFSQQNPEALVEAALHATAFHPLLQALQFSLTEAAKLNSQIKEMTEATPKLQPGGQDNNPDNPPPKQEIKQGSRPMQVAETWMKGLPNIR